MSSSLDLQSWTTRGQIVTELERWRSIAFAAIGVAILLAILLVMLCVRVIAEVL